MKILDHLSKRLPAQRPDKKPFRDTRVLLGIPSATGCFNGTCLLSFCNTWVEIAHQSDIMVAAIPGALVYNARLGLLSRAIEGDFTHVMMIDDDVQLAPGNATALLHAIKAHDYTMVAGIVPVRRDPPMPSVVWKDEDGWLDSHGTSGEDVWPGVEELEKNPVYPCAGFGLAAVVLDLDRVRTALNRFYGGRWDYRNECRNPFLPLLHEERGKVLGEDLAFCRRVREGGGKLAVATAVQPNHYNEEPLHLIDYLKDRQRAGMRI